MISCIALAVVLKRQPQMQIQKKDLGPEGHNHIFWIVRIVYDAVDDESSGTILLHYRNVSLCRHKGCGDRYLPTSRMTASYLPDLKLEGGVSSSIRHVPHFAASSAFVLEAVEGHDMDIGGGGEWYTRAVLVVVSVAV